MHIVPKILKLWGINTMPYKSHYCGMILIIPSFFAMAAGSDSLEKCASIALSSERVKCYDSLTKRPAKKQDSPVSSVVSKNKARDMFIENFNSDTDLRANPIMKETMICVIERALDETFGTATWLDSTTFQRQMGTALDRITAGMKNEDPAIAFKALKCAIKSTAPTQPVENKIEQDRFVPLIDMDDLRIDINSLIGQKIRVQGVGNYVMNIFMLKKNSSDMSPMVIDITKLQRDQYKKILQQCADIMTGCRVTVYGTVGKVNYQNGIFAEAIEW